MVNFRKQRAFALAAVFALLLSFGVRAAEPQAKELVPLGATVGMKLSGGGLLIAKLDVVSANGKSLCPARQAGLAAGI